MEKGKTWTGQVYRYSTLIIQCQTTSTTFKFAPVDNTIGMYSAYNVGSISTRKGTTVTINNTYGYMAIVTRINFDNTFEITSA